MRLSIFLFNILVIVIVVSRVAIVRISIPHRDTKALQGAAAATFVSFPLPFRFARGSMTCTAPC